MIPTMSRQQEENPRSDESNGFDLDIALMPVLKTSAGSHREERGERPAPPGAKSGQ